MIVIKRNSNKHISWNYLGKEINVIKNRILFFRIYGKQVFIVFEGIDKTEEQEFLDFNGEFIYSVKLEEDCIQYRDRTLRIPNLLSAKFDDDKKYFYCLVGADRLKSSLYLYTVTGEIYKEIHSPIHFQFYGLEYQLDGSVTVVCMGDDTEVDKYGRRDWKFSLDTETWKLNKISMSR